MALGALAENAPVTVIPVGLTYFSAHKFRSRAVVEFGDAVPVAPSLVKGFKDGRRREAIRSLMGDISQALAAVTVSAPDFDTLMVCLTPFSSRDSTISRFRG
jgi:glycerol-3-phosphate O-acyltransferase/dihydroxyacetone phosphate acyltransferase